MEITLEKIAEIVDGKIYGDSTKIIQGAAPFYDASKDEITLAGDAKFLNKIDSSKAGAIIVPQKLKVSPEIKSIKINLVIVNNPQVAFAKVLSVFFPPSNPGYFADAGLTANGISSDARIGTDLQKGRDILIAPFVVIGKNVKLGDRVTLYPNVVIGDSVEIGNDVKIYPNVTIYDRCIIGKRVIIHGGSVIGSDGFGFAPDGTMYHKIPHTGIVKIDDDVEIGASNTIDRATFGCTWIQKGVKTDNLVHIAHNVTVGKNSVLVAQVGISGSTVIGKNAVLAGQAGIAGHLTLGDNVTIGPQAGVAKSIPNGKIMSGTPEIPHRLWLRVQSVIPKLPDLKKKISELEKRLQRLEKETGEK